MPIHPQHTRDTIDLYLDEHPDERPDLTPALDLLNQGVDVNDRHEWRGHLTASAALLNPTGQVLLVHHRAYDLWTTPGGHAEPRDSSLLAAAFRELIEETGLRPDQVTPAARSPIRLKRHQVPARPDKNEPQHWHIDVCYLMHTSAHIGTLQIEEITDARWQPLTAVTSPILRSRLEKAAASTA